MNRTTHLIAAIGTALVLASCGSGGGEPIPERRAATLERLLQQAQRQSDAGACTTLLDTTIPRLEREARRLPDGVGEDTRTTIEDGVAHLRDLTETDCTERQQNELPTTQSTDSTTTTTPSPTTTEQTTTEKPPSTSTDTSPSTETTPPETTPPDTGNGGTPPDLPPGQGGTPPGQQKGDEGEDDEG